MKLKQISMFEDEEKKEMETKMEYIWDYICQVCMKDEVMKELYEEWVDRKEQKIISIEKV